jgi:hypothetical protein
MPRTPKLLSIIAASVLAFIAVAASAILWLASGSSADEVARVPSPQGEVEAVLVETNGGATTSFGYEVFVVPRGTREPSNRAAHLYGAVRNSNAYGANLRWSSPTELVIEFEQASSSKLELPLVAVSGLTVRVTLRPGVTDSSAPPGGMLFNLRGRRV